MRRKRPYTEPDRIKERIRVINEFAFVEPYITVYIKEDDLYEGALKAAQEYIETHDITDSEGNKLT